MASWSDLSRELDRWVAEGREAPFWWRDDDAVDATPQLERMLELAMSLEVPLSIAVIPEGATGALAERLKTVSPTIAVLQHGYAHRDHAAFSIGNAIRQKRIELGGGRSADQIAGELCEGRDKLRASFGKRFRAVVVPPWNRIDAAVTARLPSLGFSGLSAFGPLPDQDGFERDTPDFIQANSHIDIFRWRPVRAFLGEGPLLEQILRLLTDARARLGVHPEPFGLMTHHLVHDEDCWSFVERLLDLSQSHKGARWLTVDEVFPPSRQVSPPRQKAAQ